MASTAARCVLSCLLFSALTDGLKLPNAISSNMVLQRAPLAARIFGFGTASEVITVTLDGVAKTVTVGASGYWVLELEQQQASTNKTILIDSSLGDHAVLKNIAFGDVYLCSGQSNMEFSVNDAFNAAAEIADSVNYPNLRIYSEKKVTADTPQHDGVTRAPYQWGVSEPASFVPVGGGSFSYISATCYFFGRDLYKGLGGQVPIGLVASDWGGQKVEVFSSPDALADTTCGGTVDANDGFKSAPDAATTYSAVELESLSGLQEDKASVTNSQLWNAMIYPFIDMRFTGATWYQGEANAGDPASYACRFPAMIADWRKKFDLPGMSFFFVQLAAYGTNYAEIRNAQMAALKLPKVGYAVAIDIGDPTSPEGDIHPRRKQEVGRRLALACQQVQYGMNVVSTGPLYESFQGDASSVSFTFSQATSAGLHFAGTAACKDCCNVSPFEVLGAQNYSWMRTGAGVINGNVVTAPIALAAGDSIVGVRYDWEGYPQCALYNGQGGPDDHLGIAATPFHVQKPAVVKSWQPVFRQTLPGLWQPGVLSLNPQDENADMFAKLDTLKDMLAASGSLEFKQRWADPQSSETNHWKQTSNPVTNAKSKVSGVTGYEAINVKQTGNSWGGLEYNAGGDSLLDGSIGANTWFYAIGYKGADWGQGLSIPAFGRGANAVELFAMSPKTSKWTLVFRQTLPHLWDTDTLGQKDPWSVNANDTHAEVYSILDTLEEFRGADGKFELKMMWPDYYNIWSQTSDPTSATAVSGYTPIEVKYAAEKFGGLALNSGGPANSTMIKGSDGSAAWYYAIGYEGLNWGQATIPAYSENGQAYGANQAELFVYTAKSGSRSAAAPVFV